MKVLVVGGTGPTGPHIVQGLLDRGHDVTILHRGYHEIEEIPEVPHIHGDPFDKEALERDFANQYWDIVVCTYGRLRWVADALVGHTPKLVAVGGFVSYLRPEDLPFPQGLAQPISEDHPTVTEFSDEENRRHAFGVAHTERAVMEHNRLGHFGASMFRYAGLYAGRGTRNRMWPIVRRVMDKRPYIIVPGDAGASFSPSATAKNAAHMIMLACEKPEADGHIFNPTDEKSYSLRDLIRIIADELHHDIEIISINHPLAEALATGYSGSAWSWLMDTYKLKTVLGYHDIETPEEGIRNAARWISENWHQLDEDQMNDLVGNPYAYEVEDQLVASFKKWQQGITDTLPVPKVGRGSQEPRGRFIPPEERATATDAVTPALRRRESRSQPGRES